MKNKNNKNKHNKNNNIKKFEYKIIDRPDKDFVYIGTNCFTPPETDNISIYILNNEIDADLIFKIIDDMTEYFTSELGLNIREDILIMYDETDSPIDRFAKFF